LSTDFELTIHRQSDILSFVIFSFTMRKRKASLDLDDEKVGDPGRQHTLTTKQQYIIDEITMGQTVFITGPAGVGKSFMVHEIQKLFGAAIITTALTGIAACNIDGRTIHSVFGIHKDTDTIDVKKIAPKFDNVEMILVDECSMASVVLIENISTALKKIKRSSKDFGGIQMIFVGDFLQLPCLTKEETPLYESSIWRKNIPLSNVHYLTEPMRQRNASDFRVLCKLRKGIVDEEVCRGLRAASENKEPQEFDKKLYYLNQSVRRENKVYLNSLQSPTIYLKTTVGQVKGYNNVSKVDEYRKNYPDIPMKVGARVRLNVNYNPSYELVNGTEGIFEGLIDDFFPEVFFPKLNLSTRITPWTHWFEKKRIWVVYFPLQVSHASTIHKAQGQTYDSCYVDLSKSSEYGMVYVALSRVRSLSKLRITPPITEIKPVVDPKALAYYQKIETLTS